MHQSQIGVRRTGGWIGVSENPASRWTVVSLKNGNIGGQGYGKLLPAVSGAWESWMCMEGAKKWLEAVHHLFLLCPPFSGMQTACSHVHFPRWLWQRVNAVLTTEKVGLGGRNISQGWGESALHTLAAPAQCLAHSRHSACWVTEGAKGAGKPAVGLETEAAAVEVGMLWTGALAARVWPPNFEFVTNCGLLRSCC